MENHQVTDFPERIEDRGLFYVRDDSGMCIYNLVAFCTYTLETSVGEEYPPQITCNFKKATACVPQEQAA